MATVDAIRDAIDKCANLIITHEPIFFTGEHQTDWLVGDRVYSLEVAMKHRLEWICTLMPCVPLWFSEAGEPFVYVYTEQDLN
jgi:hypothetical protein